MTTTLRFAAAIAVLTPVVILQAESTDTFEVASVKPQGAVPAGGGRGTASPGGAGLGCDGGFPRVDGSRFSVTTTPYALITWAYGYNKTWGCSYVSYGDLLTGGPSWIRSERFEIQARIPEGAPIYTFDQFMKGDAPGLEKMLKALLADRFKLVVIKKQGKLPDMRWGWVMGDRNSLARVRKTSPRLGCVAKPARTAKSRTKCSGGR